jgi:hypothetical protein
MRREQVGSCILRYDMPKLGLSISQIERLDIDSVLVWGYMWITYWRDLPVTLCVHGVC